MTTRKHAGGRPPLSDEWGTLKRVTVALPQDYLDWAREEGHGNLSEGLRRLLEELDERRGAARAAAP